MIARIKEVDAKKLQEEKDKDQSGTMTSLVIKKKKAKHPMDSSDDTVNSKMNIDNSKKVLQEIEMISMAKKATIELEKEKL